MEMIKILFGYFDLVVIIGLLYFNFRFWNKLSTFNNCLSTTIFFVTFGLVLPLISMIVEIQLYSNPGDDAFNLLYTYFRFPVYWVIGVIQLIVIGFRLNKSNSIPNA